MGAGHVRPNLAVEAWHAVVPGSMLDAEDDVEELDQGTLAVAAASELTPLATTVAFVVKDAPGQACCGHIFAAGKVGADVVIENPGVALLVHAVEKRSELVDTFGHDAEGMYKSGVALLLDGFNCPYHDGNDVGSFGFYCDRNHVEPRLIFRAGKGMQGLQGIDVAKVRRPAAVVPEVQTCVGSYRW